MSYKAITIYTPSGTEPHITAEDDAFIYNSIFAGASGILGELACTRVNDNTVRLSGGGAANEGYVMYIPYGSTHDVTIATGSQELGRHDLVVSRFTRGGGTTADTHAFAVVQGTPAVSPVDPSLSESELASSGDVNEVALFRVTLSGLAITSIEQVAHSLGNRGLSQTTERLATARTISLSGDAQGSVSFDGSADAAITAAVTHVNGTKITVSASAPANPSAGDLWIHYGG